LINKKKINIVITGANGFIAKNLISRLQYNDNFIIHKVTKKTKKNTLKKYLLLSDAVFHLAGINKEVYPEYMYNNNYSFIEKICLFLENNNKKTRIFYASSTQVKLNNSYGKSKLKAEKILLNYKRKIGAQVFIYRLPNVFGKWSKPYYNSAVATFCYQIYKKKNITISDPNKKISLLYIDDLINIFLKNLNSNKKTHSFIKISNSFSITLFNLVKVIRSFNEKEKLFLPNNISNNLIKNLYSTYISYFSKKDFKYKLKKFSDKRGYFSEFLKNSDFGQISFFSILPKQVRGNHYHNTKTEKFVVIAGKAKFNFVNIINKKRFSILTNEKKNLVINTIPGWAHNIENTGSKTAKVLVWANEILNRKNPDTIFYKV
jgi:UDP-2-acetamido-2,6-beta-L-arabino-hexul-4-ose reductase